MYANIMTYKSVAVKFDVNTGKIECVGQNFFLLLPNSLLTYMVICYEM